MAIIWLVLIAGLAFLFSSLPAFELVFGVLLLTPVMAHLAGMVMPVSALVYDSALVLLLAVFLTFRSGREKRSLDPETFLEESLPLLLFCLVYSGLLYLCHLWPDFINLGERLRDYAILSSVINSPFEVKEPWMVGQGLNYYAYWYRFGAMLAAIGQYPVWEVYHQLLAFSLAFYTAVAFRLFRRHLHFSCWGALAAALLIAGGSNFKAAGIFLSQQLDWWKFWGISRVIQGTINEFPAWSFLLGDLHPHYLNLALIPFSLLLFLDAARPGEGHSTQTPLERPFAYLALLILLPLWIMNANAWEMPVWACLTGILLLGFALASWGRWLVLLRWMLPPLRSVFSSRGGFLILIFMATALALWHGQQNFSPGDGNGWTWVQAPVARSLSLEFVAHWGFPLFLVALANVILLPAGSWRFFCLVLMVNELRFDRAYGMIILLLAFNLLRLFFSATSEKRRWRRFQFTELFFELLGLASLIVLLAPELGYFDDPYGGENERMNTIFKFYSANWFLLHAYAFYLTQRAAQALHLERIKALPVIGAQVIVMVCMLGFFWQMTGIRRSEVVLPTGGRLAPGLEGLSEVAKQFPGSPEIIRKLRSLPASVVLEAQGPAYSYTAFVSTLAGQTSYLGWANHVNLLTRAYGEVQRREKFTEAFYLEPDCTKKLDMLRREGISHVVLGQLEKTQYKALNPESFGCFNTVLEAGEYKLLQP